VRTPETLADASGIDQNSKPVSNTFEQRNMLSHLCKRARNVTRTKTDSEII